MGNGQVETIHYLSCRYSFPQKNIIGVLRDWMEQGVGAPLLLSGIVGAGQKKIVKDTGGMVTKLSDRHR